MTNEQALLIRLMRSVVTGQPPAFLAADSFDRQALWQEACAQAVPILCFDMLDAGLRCAQDEPAFPEVMTYQALSFLSRNAQNTAMHTALIQLLEQLKCPYVILKGIASSAYYPDPTLRLLGDIDLLVPPHKAQDLATELERHGYLRSDKKVPHHITFFKDGVVLELHTEVGGIPCGAARDPIVAFLAPVFAQSQTLQLQQLQFQAPCEKHNALIQLLHMLYHIEEYGFGLRHLMDWACFVNATAQADFWPELLALLKQVGLFYYAAAITKMASLYLGSPCPDWAQEIEEALCRDMLKDIMTGGNFGRKDPDRTRSATMLPDWEADPGAGKLLRMFQVLRQYILREKPELSHKPVRLFFVILYRCCRFVVLRLQGKRPNLLRAATIAENRKAIYKQLKLYLPDN